ncbi:MAG: phosphoribosylformylglycinamidine synthase [Clostridia bacterium]|nr:phosphoribosylformylglycinamidine synthase [Clostridia bacterium]
MLPKVYKIYVEKREEFSVESSNVLEDIKLTLNINSNFNLKIINRYFVEGIDEKNMEKAVKTVFSDPVTDITYEELEINENQKYFVIEYLPGQYDQRADSAAQCIALFTGEKAPTVRCAKIYIFDGDLSESDFERIKNYLINPLESKFADLMIPETLALNISEIEKEPIYDNFNSMSDEEIENFHRQNGFAMSLDDLKFCRDYFKNTEKRNPTKTELKVIDTYWSDHCRHTTFLTKLENIEVEESKYKKVFEDAIKNYFEYRSKLYKNKNKDVCLMDMATIGTKVIKSKGLADDLDESEEINACSINITVDIDGKKEPWLLQFKNETHNHPTEIEPFGGAATCLGGAIRDPLSGRAYVYQAMRITGAGNPLTPLEETIEGKLPQKKITTGACDGYSSYGNQIGLATSQVFEVYDPGYTAKRMELGAVIAASPKENVIREIPVAEDIVILLGGRTGRDGCGGATGSSKCHDLASLETCGAEVQKGNPPIERKIQRLFRNPKVAKMIKRCNDFGAGGVSVAIGELSPGLEIDLNTVLKKYEGLNGTELAISESQERMAIVLDKKDKAEFLELAKQENLEATQVATVTDTNRLKMIFNGETIVDISREFLDTNGVTQTATAVIKSPENISDKLYKNYAKENLDELFFDNLTQLNVCAQKGMVEHFDSTIGAGSVLMPFAGKYQLTPEEAIVGKIPVISGKTNTCSTMSFGFTPEISKISPFHGAYMAVVMSLARLVAIGGTYKNSRLTFQEYFEKLEKEPTKWGKPASALLGALKAQIDFSTPAIGGKDSMSGTFNDISVPPTLVSFAVNTAEAEDIKSTVFEKESSKVYLIKLPISKSHDLPEASKVIELFDFIQDGLKNGKIKSAGVVREGGAIANVIKRCFGNKLGFAFDKNVSREDLFSPYYSSFVIETEKELNSEFDIILLGETIKEKAFYIEDKKYDLEEVLEKWLSPLESVFPTKASKQADTEFEIAEFNTRNYEKPNLNIAKPKVIIPVFPGTNCEYDTQRAFEKAGANAEVFVIKNLNPQQIEESILEFSKKLKESQILMIPGGFSAGDEPDGSGKFIAAFLRSERIKEAVCDLFENRKGLILGICNGFQALIKTGLVPYGEIKSLETNDPTLTYNYIGRHVSTFVQTKITSVKSPWFSNVEVGDIHSIPVSHGEGRFTASLDVLKMLNENGQIATQYVDLNGNVSDDIRFNPNGSVCAIEGITDKTGRILGKMGHSERYGENIHKNIPGNKDQKIFLSGVEYFK